MRPHSCLASDRRWDRAKLQLLYGTYGQLQEPSPSSKPLAALADLANNLPYFTTSTSETNHLGLYRATSLLPIFQPNLEQVFGPNTGYLTATGLQTAPASGRGSHEFTAFPGRDAAVQGMGPAPLLKHLVEIS